LKDALEFFITVNPDEADAEYRHDLALELGKDLNYVDGVLSVKEQQEVSQEAGAKGLLVVLGVIVASISVVADLATIADVLAQWLNRDRGRRSATVTLNGKTFTLQGLSNKEHQDLITWLKTETQAEAKQKD
jgi:hypothetical protein